ncbi:MULTISPECIES: NAD(P)/FAD-dependent oxidoreductase [unclassified Marinobacter]|uniref:Membrane protein n=1 Tax=Marinobacter nauticus TaxID=2743 RepID=A0A455WAK1_MARNT|nr:MULTISPECIES: NAD(P)/FAD-dependent oxidoreductase [unclassified Marinobacter]QFS86320.1 tricarballylate dehydrogenase [Marinobacter sp. THAF197a]QFT50101.1 tricarballylate dehydrogenase [Marinobacter sp. THAF39]BBJ03323.1 membrane protein [Marinobacter nauticus]
MAGSTSRYDVIIIGAGAAGLMCAATAGYRGRKVLVLDHANKPGKKILMSGGGRCNFTNLNSTPANFLSDNPHYCISALKRYTPQDFVELVDRHGVEYEEKAPGQLFCKDSAKDILNVLLTECEWAGAEIRMNTSVSGIRQQGSGFSLKTSSGTLGCESLIVACGGLSIPTMGATGFGYEIAKQFGLGVLPTRAGLVPFTLHPELKQQLAPLSGVSCPVDAHCHQQHFREPMLVTHRGLSGPAMLQVSSYWQPGDAVHINLLPAEKIHEDLLALRSSKPQSTIAHYLNQHLPKRFAQAFNELHGWSGPLQGYRNQELEQVAGTLGNWTIKPAGTEGYRTAEVTLGGVDTRQLSSKTMAALDRPNLYFIGEVVDVTGHLGGHNFQWAWASGVAAGNVA